MIRSGARALLFLLGILTGPLVGHAVALDLVPVPPLTGRVVDLTGTLTDQDKQQIESMLADVETQKGSQIAVLIVPTTQPEAIEQYSLRVAEAWKIGRKRVDDGFLFLVAKDDHQMRFEVGYGLEGALPDALCKRIIDEIVAPSFRSGDFAGGITAGLQAAIKVIQGEPLPAPTQQAQDGTAGGAGAPGGMRHFPLQTLLIFAFVGVIVCRSLFGRVFGSIFGGALVGGLVWFALGSLFLSVILGVLVFVFALIGLASGVGGFMGGGGFYGGGGFGGSGGFGGGGGGFGGGGGSFGGGGASGSW